MGKFGAEMARKCIHLLIALVPLLASMSLSHTALLLMGGLLFYTWTESLRFLGFFPPLVSSVTAAVSRKREEGRFVLAPVTLGLGALLALLIFPAPVAAAAIYALAFGDSASTLVGRFLGRIRPAFMAGKSIEGSIACFAASGSAAFLVFSDWKTAVAVGFSAMIIDFLSLGDFDNIVMPLAAGIGALVFQGI